MLLIGRELTVVMESMTMRFPYAVVILLLGLLLQEGRVAVCGKCEFQAIFNFGDSNSDTGTISAAISQINPPNGETFFKYSTGRYGDGRLIIDLIAERLKLPYLSPYLDSIGTDFRHGANFAAGGASIRQPGFTPFDFGVQISQFKRFKACTMELYNNRTNTKKTEKLQSFKAKLPTPMDFSKGLYTVDLGQNDLSYGFQHSTEEQVRMSIPDILRQFSQLVNQLYKEGARIFWVHNTGPVGCLPYTVIYYEPKKGNLDAAGCVKPQNQIVQEFNRQLKDVVLQLNSKLSGSSFTYADVYSAKYNLISNAKKQGFVDPMSFCCGSYYGYHIDCGKQAVVNGTVYGIPCPNPSRHISWDGIHYTESANLWVANRILNGSLSYPPSSVDEACKHGKA